MTAMQDDVATCFDYYAGLAEKLDGQQVGWAWVRWLMAPASDREVAVAGGGNVRAVHTGTQERCELWWRDAPAAAVAAGSRGNRAG